MPTTFEVPKFATEDEEVQWWETNRERLSEEFIKAGAEGRLRRGTVMKLAMAADMGLQLTPAEATKATEIAERKGVTFQEYINLLVHEGLEREEAA